MNTTQTSSVSSTLRFVFWWLLAQLAETAIRVRSSIAGVPQPPQANRVGDVEPFDRGTTPSDAPIYASVTQGPFTGGSSIGTGHVSLKPLALAGLAAYVMGIAVVLLIRSQFV